MKFSGLGFKDPYHWQFLKQMQSFVREWERPSITNQLLHGVIEQQIVELGFQPAKGEWLFGITEPYLTDGWWKDLLCYCYKYHWRLELEIALPKRTTTDRFSLSLACYSVEMD